MKNASTIFAFILFFSSTLSAQITVTSDDLYDYIGATYQLSIDTLPDASIHPGMVGNTDWDFSSLQQHESFSWSIELPAGTPFEADYPDATFVLNEEDEAWVYYEKTADVLNLLGVGIEDSISTLSLTYQPKQKVIQFPLDYNSAFSDISKQALQFPGAVFGLPVDSIKTETTINRGVVVDGFGSMTVPGGTVEALRVETRTVSFDSIYILAGGAWSLFEGDQEGDTTLQYSWVSNEAGWDIPIVSIDGELDNTGAFIVTDVLWLIEPLISSTKNVAVKSFELFPNPTTDILNVKFKDFTEGAVEVIDFNGKSVIKQSFENTSISLNLEQISLGNYVLVFKNKNGELAGFKQFSVAR